MTVFNIENYLNHSRRIDLSEFDLSNARQYSLTADEVRCLKYMMDVESSTIVYLRGLLRTAIVDDPEAVAFSGMRRIIEAEIGSSNQIGKASGSMTANAAFLIPTME